LTETEIDMLANALGRPAERETLAYWVGQAINGVARFSTLPSPRQVRMDLIRMARDGRQWLRHADSCTDLFSVRMRREFEALAQASDAFFQSVDVMASDLAVSAKAGRPRTHFAFVGFLEKMIGIAKRAKVRPSTPMRALSTKKPAPAFFQFVVAALSVANDVIASSPLPRARRETNHAEAE
jgi:hypothetical protein